MKLDKFQQFVKDGKYEPNLNVIEAKEFARKLKATNFGEADDIESNVNGAIEFGEIYENSLYHIESLSTMAMNSAIKLHVNKLIQKTIEGIEDTESDDEFEPEDCMDIDKRDKEINRA